MKKVKCIDNKGQEDYLTLNKIYEVIKENSVKYYVKDDIGGISYYRKAKFKVIKNNNTQNPTNPTHYHTKIQPIEFIEANNLGFHEGNVIKYITRYKDKNGIEDLEKAKTYIEMLIEKIKRENV